MSDNDATSNLSSYICTTCHNSRQMMISGRLHLLEIRLKYVETRVLDHIESYGVIEKKISWIDDREK